MAKTLDPISLNDNEKQNAWAVVTFLQRSPLHWLNPRIINNTELHRKQNRKMQRNIKKRRKKGEAAISLFLHRLGGNVLLPQTLKS